MRGQAGSGKQVNIVEEIARCRQRFLEEGADPRDMKFIRSVIAESWIRSRDRGLDPEAPLEPPRYTGRELDEMLARSRDLIECAAPFVLKLQQLVADTNYVIALYDPEGMILDLRGSREMLALNAKFDIAIGSVSAEQTIGTCAHGLCMLLGKPVTVRGAEHYNVNFTKSNCAAAPVFFPDGVLAGILTMESIATEFQLMKTLDWVSIVAWAIQERLAQQRGHQATAQTESLKSMAESSDDEAVLIADDNGRITYANYQAKRLFGKHVAGGVIGKSYVSLLGHRADVNFAVGERYRINTLRLNIPHIAEEHIVKFIPGNMLTPPARGVAIRMLPMETVRDIINLFDNVDPRLSIEDLVLNNGKMRGSIDRIVKTQRGLGNMLLIGERGTGRKALCAAIHHATMPNAPFVVLQCKTTSTDQLRRELFGGIEDVLSAREDDLRAGLGHLGKYDLAAKGTLLLTGIESLPRMLQEELADRLENDGGAPGRQARHPRIVATASPSIARYVYRGRFSKRLYDQIGGLRINVPRLCDRIEDIAELAQNFLECFAGRGQAPALDDETRELLEAYSWPGNITELQNAMRHALVNCTGAHIVPSHLPPEVVAGGTGATELDLSQELTFAQMEKLMIEHMLAMTSDTKTIAATLGIGRTTLYRKIKEYGIHMPRRD